jgi:hypothetical protein
MLLATVNATVKAPVKGARRAPSARSDPRAGVPSLTIPKQRWGYPRDVTPFRPWQSRTG